MNIPVDNIAPPEPKRDRWGRYIVNNPNGDPVARRRVTTISKALDDPTAIHQWQLRKAIYGATSRPDYIDLAQSHHPDTHKKIYTQLVEDSLEAAQTKSKANTGTALHAHIEAVTTGRQTIDQIPDQWQPHIHAYFNKLDQLGITLQPQHCETIIVNDNYEYAGTLDGVGQTPNQTLHVADLKTGSRLDNSWTGYKIQLAAYAHHDATYNPATNKRGPQIPLDLETAFLIHLPSDRTPDNIECVIYEIDLTEGYDALLCALEVLEHRKILSRKPSTYQPGPIGNGQPNAETAWIKDRIKQLEGNPQAIQRLLKLWPTDIPQPIPDTLTTEQTDALAAALDKVERAHELPISPPRPGTKPAKGGKKTQTKTTKKADKKTCQ